MVLFDWHIDNCGQYTQPYVKYRIIKHILTSTDDEFLYPTQKCRKKNTKGKELQPTAAAANQPIYAPH
jgi:hypothetical protein